MKYLNTKANRSIISLVPYVIKWAQGRMRLLAGLGINVMGAALLLRDGLRFLSP